MQAECALAAALFQKASGSPGGTPLFQIPRKHLSPLDHVGKDPRSSIGILSERGRGIFAFNMRHTDLHWRYNGPTG